MSTLGGNELINVDIFDKVGIEAGMHVADLGCGNLAYFSFPIAKLVGDDGVVYAVDILKSVLEAVDNKIKQVGAENIKTIWSNLEIIGATKIPDENLDVAFLVNVLFQSEKDDIIIKEAYRLLKPQGKLLIIDWLSTSTPFGPPIKDRPKKEVLKKYAQDSGLQLIEEFEAGPYHFGL